MQDAPPLQLYPASDKFLMWNQRKAALAFFFSNINNSDTCICNNHNEVLYMFLLTISFCVKLEIRIWNVK